MREPQEKNVSKLRGLQVAKPDGMSPMQKVCGDIRGARKKEALYVRCSAYCIRGDDRSSVSGVLILPNIFTRDRKFDPIGTRTIFHIP
jgi:hypothetical protein